MPELVIGEERFACRERIDEWALMKLAKSQQGGDTMQSLAGMYDFINSIVVKGERHRLDAYMSSGDVEPGALSEAIGTLVTEYAGRPTERPSSSPTGSPSTGASSKAASSSPDTVRVVNLSPTGGQSAAS